MLTSHLKHVVICLTVLHHTELPQSLSDNVHDVDILVTVIYCSIEY